MRYYEAIFIVQPNLEQNELYKLIGDTKNMLEKRDGELLYEEVMGKRRLAYPIQKQRFGTYVLLQFRGDGAGNARLNQDLELKDNILAHMIVRIDEEEVREARREASEEDLKAPAGEELAVKVDDEAPGAVDEEQDQAVSDTEQEEASPDEQGSPSGEENLEPETKE
ncbi:hypothetical protein ES703_67440 [subsurface metagenome]